MVFFSFYDPDGIIDEYVFFLLKSFKGIADEIVTIVNGQINKNAILELNRLSKIIIRENKGFDAWAYKTGFEKYGFENLKKFDEVICLNHTCFGPIYPWNEMFERMSSVECDWWSLFKDHCPQNYVPGEHLPSYFIVYRRSIIETPFFKEFWDSMPPIENYEDDVVFFENRQTPFFDKYGLKRAVAFDFSKFDSRQDNWPLTCTKELLIDDKLPLLKRRPFFVTDGNFDVNLYLDVFSHISRCTNYDLDLIINNLIRTQDYSFLKKRVHSKLLKIRWKIKSILSIKKSKRAEYRTRLYTLPFYREVYNYLWRKNVF